MQRLVAENKPPEQIVTRMQELMARAIGNAIKATELQPNNYQNWLNLGALYQSIAPLGIQGSLESAVAAFDRTLELRPNSPSVFYAMAGIERAKGNMAESRSHIEKAISARNQYTDAIFLLAQIQLEQNDVKNAIKSVQAVTVFEPSNAVAFFQLGLLHYGSNDFAQASQAFRRAIVLNDVYANARYFLGLTEWRMGNVPQALSEFRKVLSTNQENAEVRTIVANLEAGLPPFGTTTPTTPVADINTREALPIPGGDTVGTSTQPITKEIAE
jgi:tetratricopeptide (TPR) repeat protein